MAEVMQCANCGAALAEEDVFCGECGAPRPVAAEQPQAPVVEEQAATSPAWESPVSRVPSGSAPAPSQPSGPVDPRWRTAFVILVAVGAFACLAGLVGFLLVGLVGGENTTPEENWIISTLCCLVPLGGSGAILAAAGAAIWYTRLRNR